MRCNSIANAAAAPKIQHAPQGLPRFDEHLTTRRAYRLVDDVEARLERAEADPESARSAILDRSCTPTGALGGVVFEAWVLRGPGTELGKLVPEGKPSRVVAFVSEADRAFLSVGSAVPAIASS